MSIRVKNFLLLILLISSSVAAQNSDTFWSVSTIKGDTYSNKVASLNNESSNSVRNKSNSKDVFPFIEFYCQTTNSDIYLEIDWKRFISSFNKTEIGIVIDNARTEWLAVKVDKKNAITRLVSAKNTQEIINKLLTATSLKIEIEPYSEPAISSEYNLQNFSSKLNEFIQICKK